MRNHDIFFSRRIQFLYVKHLQKLFAVVVKGGVGTTADTVTCKCGGTAKKDEIWNY